MEVAVISSGGESVSSAIWNPFTNSMLASYLGGGCCSDHGLVSCSGYIIANEKNKPMLHAWPLNKQHFIKKRLIAPGKISCVAMSPDGCYIALSVDTKLHVYQTASGVLCGTGSNHFQPINIIRFNPEGTFIGCGGEDGLLTLWHLSEIVQIDQSTKKPFLSLNAHSLPITDLIFTGGDLRSRVITSSLDRSCKIHNVWTHDKLLATNFENQLTALTLCPRESAFYVGDADGNVREIGLLAPPRKVENHILNSSDELLFMNIHQGRITALSVSLDCSLLLSGSRDSTVKLTHIKSRQCIQTISQKGPVTNCFFYVLPSHCFATSFRPSQELRDFSSKESPDNFSFDTFTPTDISSNFPCPLDETTTNVVSVESETSLSSLDEVTNLKEINHELYKFAMKQILHGSHKHLLQPEIVNNKSNVNTNKKKIKRKK